MFYLNIIEHLFLFVELLGKLEVYYKVDRLITGLIAKEKGTTAQ